jgi:hypothetical protein
MSDFKSAFSDGLDAAQKAETARREIEDVFRDLSKQLAEASDGKLAVERMEYERSRSWLTALSPLEPKEKYQAIVAYNPTIKGSPTRELCEWESGRGGYPCKLTWGSNEYYCEDKQALENTLSDLLRDPIIAEKLMFLINLKAKEKNA